MPRRARHRSRAVWRTRDAQLLVAARALMMAVNSLVVVALQLRVHDAGGGPFATTALMIAMALPAVLAVGVTGVVADSHDSRSVVATAMVTQLVAAVMLSVRTDLAWTIVWAVVIEIGFAFTGPVWSALVPRVVGESGVQRLAAAQMVATSVVAPLGAGAGGWLVQEHGARVPLLVAAGVVAVATILAVAIRTRRGGRTDSALAAARDGDGPGEWRAGIRALRRDPIAWVIYLGMAPVCLLVNGIAVLEVYLVRDELHASATLYGLTELFYGAGAVAGAVLAGRLVDDTARVRATLLGFGATMAMVVAGGAAPSFWFYGAAIGALGLGNAYANGALGPLFVLRSPEAVRGRVQAAISATMNAALVVAMPLGGLLGSLVGIRTTFLLCGLAGGAGMLVMGTALWRRRAAL